MAHYDYISFLGMLRSLNLKKNGCLFTFIDLFLQIGYLAHFERWGDFNRLNISPIQENGKMQIDFIFFLTLSHAFLSLLLNFIRSILRNKITVTRVENRNRCQYRLQQDITIKIK